MGRGRSPLSMEIPRPSRGRSLGDGQEEEGCWGVHRWGHTPFSGHATDADGVGFEDDGIGLLLVARTGEGDMEGADAQWSAQIRAHPFILSEKAAPRLIVVVIIPKT